MSSRQYTVMVKLKDDGLLKKLEGVGGSAGGGSGKGVTSGLGGGDIFRKMESLGIGQLAKLTGIGVGIGALVTLTVKSSAILQSTMKLWEHGMLLIFKPIGDFIGMALRPITMALLTQMVIPFYKNVYPFFRDYGTKVGEGLTKLVTMFTTDKPQVAKDQEKAAGELGLNLMAWSSELEFKRKIFMEDLSAGLNAIPKGIVDTFTTFGSNIQTLLADIPEFIGNKFLDFGTNLWNSITTVPGFILGLFLDFGTNLWNGMLSIPGTIYDVFTGLANNLVSTLAGIPSAIYNAIMSWIGSLGGALGGGGGGGADLSSRFGGSTTRTRATMAGMADAVGI